MKPRSHAAHPDEPSLVACVALLRASVAAGMDVRGALAAVGAAVGGARGAALQHGAAALRIGVPWAEAWSQLPPEIADVVERLEPSWRAGASPGAALEAWSESALRRARADGARAAAELDSALALPVALCLLPAFVIAGVVPLLAALVSTVAGEVTRQ